jgi:hypothetical protein
MRPTPLYAPDGLISTGRYAEQFDDGLVHNHHWAVTTDEAYPCLSQDSATKSNHRIGFVETEVSPFQSHGSSATQSHDHHDDGLVHNHEWAVTGK